MPTRLKRIYGLRDLHFVTCSCYRRQPRLGTKYFRDIFLRVFEQVRRKYRFEVVGYVVMPEALSYSGWRTRKGNALDGSLSLEADCGTASAQIEAETSIQSADALETRASKQETTLLAGSLL